MRRRESGGDYVGQVGGNLDEKNEGTKLTKKETEGKVEEEDDYGSYKPAARQST